MTNEQLELLFDSDVMLGECLIVHDSEAQRTELEDIFEDISDEILMAEVKGLSKKEIQDISTTDYIATFMTDNFAGKIICEVKTPVKVRSKKGSFTTFSWGHCHYTYLIVNSIDELVTKACAWAESLDPLNDLKQKIN